MAITMNMNTNMNTNMNKSMNTNMNKSMNRRKRMDEQQKYREWLVKYIRTRIFINQEILKKALSVNPFFVFVLKFDEVEEFLAIEREDLAYNLLRKKEQEIRKLLKGYYYSLEHEICEKNKLHRFRLDP